MSNVIQFPSRARPRVARLRDAAEAAKWFEDETGMWVVDVWSGSADSVGMLGKFMFESEADACVARWQSERDGSDPRGAA